MHLHILYMHARNEVYIRQEKIIASGIGNFEKRASYRISIRRKDCAEKWYRWWNKTKDVVSCQRLFLTRADFTCTWQSYTSGTGKEKGVFHSTKISRNSSSKLNGTKSFLKFVSKILVNLSRSNPYFWKSGNSRNFLFYLSFLPGMILALVLLVMNFALTKVTRSWQVCKMICHSLACSWLPK